MSACFLDRFFSTGEAVQQDRAQYDNGDREGEAEL